MALAIVRNQQPQAAKRGKSLQKADKHDAQQEPEQDYLAEVEKNRERVKMQVLMLDLKRLAAQ
jgi:hypothetical protein